MAKIFVGKVGVKKEYDKKTALKSGQKISSTVLSAGQGKHRLCCAKGVLDSLSKQCCTVNKGGKATLFRDYIFRES